MLETIGGSSTGKELVVVLCNQEKHITSVGPAYNIGEGKIAKTVDAGSKTSSSNIAWCCFIRTFNK